MHKSHLSLAGQPACVTLEEFHPISLINSAWKRSLGNKMLSSSSQGTLPNATQCRRISEKATTEQREKGNLFTWRSLFCQWTILFQPSFPCLFFGRSTPKSCCLARSLIGLVFALHFFFPGLKVFSTKLRYVSEVEYTPQVYRFTAVDLTDEVNSHCHILEIAHFFNSLLQFISSHCTCYFSFFFLQDYLKSKLFQLKKKWAQATGQNGETQEHTNNL